MGASRKQAPPRRILVAGIAVRREDALTLARRLDQAGAFGAARRIAKALKRNERDVALRLVDRDSVLRVLTAYPDSLLELRATLLQQKEWRLKVGL